MGHRRERSRVGRAVVTWDENKSRGMRAKSRGDMSRGHGTITMHDGALLNSARCRPSPLPLPHSPPSQFPAAPLHWIYNQPKVKALTKEKGTIEFYPTSQCIIETGRPVSMVKEGLVRLHYSSCVNAKILAEPIRFVDCCTTLTTPHWQ